MIGTEWYIGEIRAFPYGVCPVGWLPCDGRLIPIIYYVALQSLIGFTFGGDMKTGVFGLPDLRGKAVVGLNNNALDLINIEYGKSDGDALHTLTNEEVPVHNHVPQADNQSGGSFSVNGTVWGTVDGQVNVYAQQSNLVAMNSAALDDAGGSGAHDNMQPYLPVYFCIACMGLYPSRS